jgi:hypothetical protein
MNATHVIAVGLLILVALIVGCDLPPTQPAPKRLRLDCSEATQAKRKALIQEVINKRVFVKVEPGVSVPKVWVGATFKALSYDDKKLFLDVVAAYYACERPDAAIVLVKIIDDRSGNTIGTFTEGIGLEMH